MNVELREIKCGVLEIEKAGVEGYWKKKKTIAYGLRVEDYKIRKG